MGFGRGNIPTGPTGGEGHNSKKVAEEVVTVELFCFLCHHKDNNYAYIFAAGFNFEFFSSF